MAKRGEGDVSDVSLIGEEKAEEEVVDSYAQCWLDITDRIATACIFANVIVLALQVDHRKWFYSWVPVELFFTLFFTTELSIRLYFKGYREFFCNGVCGPDWLWNIFDFSIVLLTWVDYVCQSMVDKKAVAMLRMLRMLRIFRILRLLKVKEFRRVAMYITGLIESSKVVGWIMVLFVMVILIFAILTTQLIGHNAELWPEHSKDPDATTRETITKQWGTIMASSATLFQFLTLDDWSFITREVAAKLGWGWYLIFTIYVLLNAVIILALLTGVITEHMMQVHRNDNEDEEREKQEKLKKVLKAIYRLFKFIDADGSDLIDRAEFQRLLRFLHGSEQDEGDVPSDMEQFLEENKDIGEALADIKENLSGLDDPELFDVFDMNGDGSLSWDEFRISMEELNKGLTKKQTFKLQATVRRVERNADAAREIASRGAPAAPADAGQQIAQVEQKIQSIDQTMDSLENSLKTVMELLES